MLMQLGVQHVVRDVTHGKHLCKEFGNLYRGSTYEYWSTLVYHLLYLFNYSIVFLSVCLIQTVVKVFPQYRSVCRNLHYIKLVNVPELSCLSTCRTGHTRQFVVHTEVVLQGNCCESLCGFLNLYMFLCFNSLMQSVAPLATFHDTTCLLVHDFHFTVDDNVFVILVEHGVSLEQLLQGVYALALYRVVVEKFVLLVKALLVVKFLIFKVRQL